MSVLIVSIGVVELLDPISVTGISRSAFLDVLVGLARDFLKGGDLLALVVASSYSFSIS